MLLIKIGIMWASLKGGKSMNMQHRVHSLPCVGAAFLSPPYMGIVCSSRRGCFFFFFALSCACLVECVPLQRECFPLLATVLFCVRALFGVGDACRTFNVLALFGLCRMLRAVELAVLPCIRLSPSCYGDVVCCMDA